MKKYEAVLFDLDGTLLPMDMEEFTHGYFKFLALKLAPLGVSKEVLVPGIWTGTEAMVRNDGKAPNDRVFWKRFEEATGIKEELVGDACYAYYSNEFKNAKVFTKENPLAKEAVEAAHKVAPKVILATNPIFPLPGQITRMSWVGLTPEDFDFVTHYESDSYCKPNPMYFIDVCKRAGVDPQKCLMIGNDEYEDMYAATKTGMDCYLVTDTMVKSDAHPWDGSKGTFKEMVEMLKSLVL